MFESRLGWHLLPDNMRLRYDDNRLAVVGETLSVDGTIAFIPVPEKNEAGLHAASSVLKAFRDAPDLTDAAICRVELWGDIVTRADQFAGRYRKLLWYVPAAEATRIVVEWVLRCAQQTTEREQGSSNINSEEDNKILNTISRWANQEISPKEMKRAVHYYYAPYAAVVAHDVYLLSAAKHALYVVYLKSYGAHYMFHAACLAAQRASSRNANIYAQNEILLEQMLEAQAVKS